MKKVSVVIFLFWITIGFCELTFLWRFKVGDIVNSCPAVSEDGVVYFGSWDGNLYAVTLDGKVKWVYNVGHIINTSAAIGHDGSIYFGADDGYLYALTPNKQLKWKFRTTRAISSSPAVGIDGTIYFGGNDTYFYALRPDGSLKWKLQLGGKVSASPVIGNDGTIYIGSEDGKLYAINDDGEIVWTFQCKSSITSSVAIDRIGRIYVADRRGNVYALSEEGKLIWVSPTGASVLSGIIIDDNGNLYFTTADARIRSLSSKGEERWSINFSRGSSTTGIVLMNGSLYFCMDEKIVGVTTDGKVTAEHMIGERTGMGIAFWKGTIFVGSFDGSVYAIRVGVSQQGGQFGKFGVNEKNQGNLMQKDERNPEVRIVNLEHGELLDEGEKVVKIMYSDNRKVKYIEIYEDNKQIKTDLVNSKEGEYEFTWNVKGEGKKELKVVAYDVGGNKGEAKVLIRVEKPKRNEPPEIPRNVSPKDGEVVEKDLITLEWECVDPDGDEIFYELYFGTVSDPPIVKSNHTTKSYQVSGLESGKTYFWRVIARDNRGGVAVGTVWRFTYKKNNAPTVPVVLSPKDGEDINTTTNQVTLSWECSDPDGDAVTYDIYFGAMNNPPLVKSNHTSKTYQVSGLESGKTYYWKIVARDSKNAETESKIWTFRLNRTNEDKRLKWKYQTEGAVASSPTIGPDGTIYVGSFDTYLYALNPDGTLKWRFQTSGFIVSDPAVGPDGTIYVGSSDQYLYAVNPNGTLKWKYQTNGGVSASPSVGPDGTIYVGSLDYSLYAISSNGTLKWKYQTGGSISSSVAIGSDGTIYFGSYDNYLYAINSNGTLKWKFQTGGGIASSPAIGADGTIYFGSLDNHLYAITPDGKPKWKYQTGGSIVSSPAVGPDGTIYVGSSDNNIYAISPNGTLKWKFQTGDDVDSSPAIGQDGTIYIGSADKCLYAISSDGKLKWRYETSNSVYSSPTIGPDGTIYFGSYDRNIYAVISDSRTISNTSWPKFKRDLQNTGSLTSRVVADNKQTTVTTGTATSSTATPSTMPGTAQNTTTSIVAPSTNLSTQGQAPSVGTNSSSAKIALGIGYGIATGSSEYDYTSTQGITLYFGQLNFAAFSGFRLMVGSDQRSMEIDLSYVWYFDFLISLGIGAGYNLRLGPYVTYMVGYGAAIPNSIIVGIHAWFVVPLLTATWYGGMIDISIVGSF